MEYMVSTLRQRTWTKKLITKDCRIKRALKRKLRAGHDKKCSASLRS